MNERSSKSRDQAETAFEKTQSQFVARSRVLDEHHEVAQMRDEKTIRLRQMRLAKEASDRTSTLSALMLKRASRR